MTADYFLDTNILIYAFEREISRKREISLSLIQPDKNWEISWQVIQEFSNIGLHKFKQPLSADFLDDFLKEILWPHCTVYPDNRLYKRAIQLHRETQYRFYDCLVVASALETGVKILYSEDLQHDRVVGDLRIINPFL